MPSFLSKVFGRKKDDKESPRLQGRASDPSLLEGKFESVSPSATKFPEVPNGKGHGSDRDKDKDKDGFALFRAKSRPASSDEKRIGVPQLSLNLPEPKEDSASRTLGVVFAGDPDAQILLGDSALGSRRLNVVETLVLVRACSQAIATRGLETLGIMHPHWYSASPDVQRRLISLFIQSLAPKSPITTLSPTSSAFTSAFESEIISTRSPHDVAAVLRWGLRHLQLENNFFGKDEGWYNNFFEAERSSGYPPNAFSTQLSPQLPAAHLELLTATLEVLLSLAAHAETNGISGSKLSKFFGLWLLTSQRVEEGDNWSKFYARWERMGCILEHLFLSRIRDEAAKSRMPTRLLELVHQYPYTKNSTSSPDTHILPRPRFTTRRYDALFVHIETELSATSGKPKHHPLQVIAEAFKVGSTPDSGSYVELWETIRKVGIDEDNQSPDGQPKLSHIFADETIRFLSLVPGDDNGKEPMSPTFSLLPPQSATRRRSFSMSDRNEAAASASASKATQHTKPATEPISTTSTTIGTDWAEFSTSGFLEDTITKPLASTLFDKNKDTEVTLPRPSKPSKGSFNFNGRKSLDAPRSTAQKADEQDIVVVSKSAFVSLTQVDEAFIDFWSDALLDPISSNWPAFVICKLKSSLSGVEVDGKSVGWLIIEQSYKRPPPPPTSQDTPLAEASKKSRPSSPKPSFRSDASTSMKKRFSFFSVGRTSTSVERSTRGRKKAGHSPKVGEMGEVVAEEDEKVETVKLRVPTPKKSADVSGKAVDAVRKSVENGKANGISRVTTGAAAATGLAALANAAAAAAESAVAPSNGSAPQAESEAVPAESNITPKAESTLPAEARTSATSEGNPAVEASPAPLREPTPVPAPVEVVLTPEVAPESPPEVTEPDVSEAPAQPEPIAVVKTVETIVESTPKVVTEAPTAEPEVLQTLEQPEPVAVVNAVETTAEPTLEVVTEAPAAEPEVSQALEQPEPVKAVETTAEDALTSEPNGASITEVASVRDETEQETQHDVTNPEETAVKTVEVNVHSEPLHTPEGGTGDQGVTLPAVPIVEVEPISGPVESIEMSEEVYPRPTTPPTVVEPAHEMPPAPESVVLSGGTPGPQVALDTSEPAALAHNAEPELKADEHTETEVTESEPSLLTHDTQAETSDALPQDQTPMIQDTKVTEEPTEPEPAVSVNHDEHNLTPSTP